MTETKYNRTLSFNAGLAEDVGITAAIVFDELSFWPDKGRRSDGWVYKSYEEMMSRLPLSKYQLRQAYKVLEKHGFIEVKIMRVDGLATFHYRNLKNLTFGSKKTSLPSIYTATNKHIDSNLEEREPNPNSIPHAKLTTEFHNIAKVLHPDKPILKTPGRDTKLRARRKSFSYEDLLRAADNLTKSRWHMGDNPNGKKYASYDFLMRSDEKVEEWLNNKPVEKVRSAF